MDDGTLKHIGVLRRSGRYPWGSGDNPQRHVDFSTRVKELRSQGISEVDIAKSQGMSSTELRTRISMAKIAERNSKIHEAVTLKDKGCSNMEIARRMGINESSVRSLLNPVLAERTSVAVATASMLKDSVDQHRFVDIGTGVENHVGVSRRQLNNAVTQLQDEGYKIHSINVEQLGMPGKFTIVKVLGAPDTTWSEIVRDPSLVQPIRAYTRDYGRTYAKAGAEDFISMPLKSVSSKKVHVVFAEDGGSSKDGVIELRRGVPDLELGSSKYAQVRIAVDGTHYLKGMAVYVDNLPPGKDIVFNTNKSRATPVMGPKDNSVLKPLESDPSNPFKSSIKPGGRRGALNVVNEEGDWDTWSRTISSQVLSKQSVPLAKKQLALGLKQKTDEYEEIAQLTNPVVKKRLLTSFADDCDASAVHLKAAALPRQASKVILPVPKLKDTEVYAPSFKNGEVVALIRHPHAGTFEIPLLTVNNNSRAAKAIMANARDAVGINPRVAKKLSGADFDGDSVIVIPNNHGLIKSSPSLKSLENFDPIERYRIPPDSPIPRIKKQVKQTKMGEVSNLITDMTIKGASTSEIARAVKHSMVVIDAEKHNLDYRQSYVDNGIAALSEKYQGRSRGGASTLISRASSDKRILERRPRRAAEGGPIDPRTGRKVYTLTGTTYTKAEYRDPTTGKRKETSLRRAKALGYEVLSTREVARTTKIKKMADEDDARALSSGRPIEEAYASYANSLKALANQARKDTLSVKPPSRSPSAAKVYELEVSQLNAKLNIANKNRPLERQAQMIANAQVRAKQQASPGMEGDELKKVRTQALAEARVRTGAKKVLIDITDREWEAIQAGAISPSKLTQIIDNSDLDRVKQLATPRQSVSLSATKVKRAQLLLESGATQSDVADALGVSVRTLTEAIKKASI